MEYKLYKGYILAPGITMPNYDIYETDIFDSVDAFRQGSPIHTSDSDTEAEQWLDRQPSGTITEADMTEFADGV